LAAVHVAPLLDLPHELLAQRLGVRHCVSVVQALKHLLPLQTKGLQGKASGVTHRPAPSQLDGPV
jgi:hypothetical protein